MSIRYDNISAAQLCSCDIKKLYGIFAEYFEYDLVSFTADIMKKKIITLLILEENNEIIGFSTNDYKVYEQMGFVVLFSGSTVVDEKYRNEGALIESYLSICASLLKQFSDKKIYWHLISMGYKTYRFLPLFFNDFYPSCLYETPEQMKELLDFISKDRFGSNYDSKTGLIHVPGCEKLLPEHAEVPEDRRKDKHIRFFLEKNPEFAEGYELSCITEITLDNFRSIPKRILTGFLND